MNKEERDFSVVKRDDVQELKDQIAELERFAKEQIEAIIELKYHYFNDSIDEIRKQRESVSKDQLEQIEWEFNQVQDV